MRWTHDPYNWPLNSPKGLGWHFDQTQLKTGATFYHGVLLRTTAGVPQYDRATALRLACHFILSRIPDQALDEVYQSLAESFCYESMLSASPRSSDRSYRSYEATTGPLLERQVFRVAED